jgi:predicted transcriptional regulator
MKTKTFLALFVCALAASAIAQAPATYTAAEAAKHVGETSTITDRVDGVHQSGEATSF